MIPRIETPRLILRAPVAADFPAHEQLMASSRASGMGGPFDQRAAWGIFCHDVANWALFGHGGLMIDVKEGGACVGQVSISHGPLFPEKDLGWFIYEGHEGRGYATEAAAALRDWAAREHGLFGLVSYIHPTNSGSIAVAERLGAVLDRDATPMEEGDLVYRHPLPSRLP